MKINTILSIFTPKDSTFIPLLKESVDILVISAKHLEDLFKSEEESKKKEFCQMIKAEETKGDGITACIFKELNKTFITPFDREDISLLADALDDVVDAIHRTSDKVLLYSPKSFPKFTVQMSELVKECSLEVQLAVYELSHLKRADQKLREHCKEIKIFEEKADVVYETGIMDIFEKETNAVELIKSKEIIQEMEKAMNKMYSAAKLLKTFIVKYA